MMSVKFIVKFISIIQQVRSMVKRIEHYKIHEQIGEGEYGKVYRGIDCRTEKEVAVKVINVKKFREYPKLQECTLNEIEVLSKIDSPHIVKFFEILKTTNNFYFFYEFCNEGTLENVIKSKGPLPEHQVLQYTYEILEAFYILSNSHIMHRDLKPSNILVNNGAIKLADFGFCKSLESHRDLAQTMLGSPIYMAPEVLKGQIYTIKADIWSLGVVMYEMIYGFCPFEERSIARLINLLDTNDCVSFNPQINQVSAGLEQLIKKMLVKDHFKRISWDEIFEYKINGQPILRNKCKDFREDYFKISQIKLTDVPTLKQVFAHAEQVERQAHVRSPLNTNIVDLMFQKQSSKENKRELKDISNQERTSNPHFTSIENNRTEPSRHNKSYSLYSNSHSSNKGHQNENSCLPIMFKKKSSGLQSSSDKENQAKPYISTMLPDPENIRQKIKYYLNLANDVVQLNFCPQVTPLLCLKMYTLIAKEHDKLPQTHGLKIEREALQQAIKIFTQQSQKCDSISGPLVTYYIKNLQMMHRECFNPYQSTITTNKDGVSPNSLMVLNHCSALLLMNEFSLPRFKVPRHQTEAKEKMILDINKKVIRNVI